MNLTNDPRLLDLLELELDGQLAPTERAELEARIAADPAIGALRAKHQALHAALAALPRIEPPLGFATRVVARARLPAARAASASLLSRLFSPAPLRYAGSFGAGAVLALLVASGGIRGGGIRGVEVPTDATAMAGALVRNSPRQTRDASPPADRLALAESGVTGAVAVVRHAGLAAVEFQLESTRPVDIAVDLEGDGLAFGGLAETGQALPPLTLDGPRIVLRSMGVRHFTLLLSATPNSAGSVRVSFSSAGAMFRTATLRVPPLG